ncbi:MAG: hypothetical protein ACOY0T_21340 [Myxococcota bacterium]
MARLGLIGGLAFAACSFAQAALAEESLSEALCGGRIDCQVTGTLGGMKAHDGTRREVWRATVPEEGEGSPEDENCTFEEFWLVALDRAGKVADKRLFASGCAPSSPETAWCGLPPRASVRVRGKVVEADWSVHALRCMSVYHSTGSYAASLEDFKPLHASSRYFRMVDPWEERRTNWDWSRMRGSWSFSTKDAECPMLRRGPIPRIPAFDLGEKFVGEAWRTADVSRCATRIDAGYGFAPKGAAAKVALQLLATAENTLFVDVKPLVRGRPLPKNAVVRVCRSEEALYSYAYCHPRDDDFTCGKFTLDGRVLEGELEVEASIPSEHGARLKVQLPSDSASVTVMYSEPSTGRWLASSQQRPLDFTYFNELHPVDADVARCELEGAELQLRFPGALSPNQNSVTAPAP